MLGMLTSPPPIFPCRRETNVSNKLFCYAGSEFRISHLPYHTRLSSPPQALKPISSDPRVMGVCFGKAEETDEERTNRMKRPTSSKRRYRDFDAVDARDHPLQEQLPPLNDDTTATVARWDWIRVTLSKSRNNYYCLVSTLDRQLFGGDELTDTVGKRTSRTD